MKPIKNNYILSQLAEDDLLVIFQRSIEGWGISKARQYAQDLEDTFNRLAKYPNLGKSRDTIFPGHSVFLRAAM